MWKSFPRFPFDQQCRPDFPLLLVHLIEQKCRISRLLQTWPQLRERHVRSALCVVQLPRVTDIATQPEFGWVIVLFLWFGYRWISLWARASVRYHTTLKQNVNVERRLIFSRMKPTRIRMCHSLVMNYGLYKKMEIFVRDVLSSYGYFLRCGFFSVPNQQQSAKWPNFIRTNTLNS